MCAMLLLVFLTTAIVFAFKPRVLYFGLLPLMLMNLMHRAEEASATAACTPPPAQETRSLQSSKCKS